MSENDPSYPVEWKPTLAAIVAAKFTDEDAKVISQSIFDCLAGWYFKEDWYADPAIPLSVLEMAVQQTLVEWPKTPKSC
jgi:hypothetical protein